jgi:aminocarboxymuconate-semialdehyde decarboxylase
MEDRVTEPRVIDVHTHFFPRSALALAGTGREWFGSLIERDANGIPVTITEGRRIVFGTAEHFDPFERRIERMDALGVDVHVVSLLPPLFRYGLPPALAIDAARAINDELARIVARWPDRFIGLATLPLQDPAASIRELDRVVGELGLAGVEIGTHVGESNLDDPALFEVLAACAARSALVFCHPAEPRGGSSMRSYYLGNFIGNPWETTVAIGSLIFGGVLERLPTLTLCFAHGGGYAPYAIGRFDHGHGVRPEARGISVDPRAQLRRLYFDSLLHDDRALRYLIDTVGIDHVVLGSDHPADMGPVDPAGAVRRSPLLHPAERDAILGANLSGLLAGLAAARVPQP